MKILIIEDEASILSFLKQGLEEENYQIETAIDGKEGLTMAIAKNYDLILLDWMLPSMSGIEICTEFRIKNKHTPIIFLTARDTVDETILGLQVGANDYIKKPFHFEELLQRIQVQLRGKLPAETNLILGDIEIDKTNFSVIKEERAIKLTQKEFSLLVYLVEHKNQVCTRSNIIKDVWDIHFEYDTGIIDVFMNAIRKKLNINNNTYIHTIRGVGYIAKDK